MNDFFANGKERIKTGINLASNSFLLLWNHPILLVYLSISIGLYLLIQLISYNSSGYDICFATGMHSLGPLFDLSHWNHYVLLFLFTYAYIILSTFVTICLIYHAYHFLNNENITIKKVINHALKKTMLILIWSTIITALAYIIQLFTNRITLPQTLVSPHLLMVILLGLAWSLFTIMVLPIITLEHTTIWSTLKKSKDIVLSLLFEIITGFLWVMLIAGLGIIPFVLPLALQIKIYIPEFVILITTLCIIGVRLVISTVQALFKTVVYWHYTKPLKELKKLKYPRF